MGTTANITPLERTDFSGGEQNKTTKFLKENNEVNKAVNAQFDRIGGVEKVKGMSKVGDTITDTTTSSTTSTSSSTTSTSTSTSTSSSTSSSTSTSSTTTA